MAVQGNNVNFVNAVTLGVNSPNYRWLNVPTLLVSRSTADPVRQNISLANNIQCVNFVAGMIANLLSATLTNTAVYLFMNTGSGVVPLSLDNGGTVGGLAIYNLKPGAAIEFAFNGTNLS
jgi:hypothetical protein